MGEALYLGLGCRWLLLVEELLEYYLVGLHISACALEHTYHKGLL
jgi:hypothetical protein